MPILALLPLALQLLPTLGRWLGGATGETVASAAAQVVQTVTGTSDPAQAEAALAANPELRVQLTTRLAEIAAQREAAADQARLEEMRAVLADVSNARSMTLGLAQARSPLAYGAVLMTIMVMAANLALVWLLLTRSYPAESKDIVLLLVGQVLGWGTAAVAYWLGSSAGSAAKDRLLAQMPSAPLALPAAGRRP